MPAVSARNEAPKREFGVGVLADRGDSTTIQTLLDCLVGCQRNQRLMDGLLHPNSPVGHVYISCVDRTGEQRFSGINLDRAVFAQAGVSRISVEMAL
ncbi:hypothetical protein [Thalassovita sp.]|uniref:hypothetical protein n=1 Tax=Thalassovita sp. TaxID=1979401 RepID=UPI00288184CA|nr:hypothetical protein [Thalassovita sp.]MDF1803988.1 hypothetical protein [Thalassovita sp.]